MKPLVPIKNLVEEIKLKMKGKVSQNELAEILGLTQSQISKKLSGKHSLTYDQAQKMIEIILSRGSLIKDYKTENYATVPVGSVFSDTKIKIVAKTLEDNNWTQVAIKDRETGHIMGLVTDRDLLNKLVSPNKTATSLEELKEMAISDSEIISHIPDYPIDTSLAEIGQVLLNYYAVLLTKYGRTVGIITRADFLELLY